MSALELVTTMRYTNRRLLHSTYFIVTLPPSITIRLNATADLKSSAHSYLTVLPVVPFVEDLMYTKL